MKHVTIAVIGHVDHGKTSLVKALTGIDTDRLEEEKARGLSIVLGFASLRSETQHVHLIDTPGHSDFVRTTCAGLSGAEAILLVVSAQEGIQSQTREHVKIAGLLGVKKAIVAITKSDLAHSENSIALCEQIRELLAAFEIVPTEIVASSSVNGLGIEELKSELFEIANSEAQTTDLEGFFLPIDRVFSAAGAGTIVTGTLHGRDLGVDDLVEIGPDRVRTSIRGLQIDGVPQERAGTGARVAVSLRGVGLHDVQRGHVLAQPKVFPSSQRLDVKLSSTRVLNHMDHVEVLIGTTHAPARIRLYSKAHASPLFAQLDFATPLTSYAGQRFVLRRPSEGMTVAGGIVMDPIAPHIVRNKPAHLGVLSAIDQSNFRAIAHALADRDHGCVDLNLLKRIAPSKPSLDSKEFTTLSNAPIALRRRDLEQLEARLRSALKAMYALRPLRVFISKTELGARLARVDPNLLSEAIRRGKAGQWLRESDLGLALTDHDPMATLSADQQRQYQDMDAQLEKMGLQPSPLREASGSSDEDMIELLIWNKRAVRLYNHSLKQSIILHSRTINSAWKSLAQANPDGQEFSTGDARECLATNRKTIVPLLEYFDQQTVTVRINDRRTIRSWQPTHDPSV